MIDFRDSFDADHPGDLVHALDHLVDQIDEFVDHGFSCNWDPVHHRLEIVNQVIPCAFPVSGEHVRNKSDQITKNFYDILNDRHNQFNCFGKCFPDALRHKSDDRRKILQNGRNGFKQADERRQ